MTKGVQTEFSVKVPDDSREPPSTQLKSWEKSINCEENKGDAMMFFPPINS